MHVSPCMRGWYFKLTSYHHHQWYHTDHSIVLQISVVVQYMHSSKFLLRIPDTAKYKVTHISLNLRYLQIELVQHAHYIVLYVFIIKYKFYCFRKVALHKVWYHISILYEFVVPPVHNNLHTCSFILCIPHSMYSYHSTWLDYSMYLCTAWHWQSLILPNIMQVAVLVSVSNGCSVLVVANCRTLWRTTPLHNFCNKIC